MKKRTFEELIKLDLEIEEKLKIFKNMDQTEEDCIKAVQYDSYFITGVKNQTQKICLAAVKNNGWALYLVKNQTVEICISVLKEDPYAYGNVKIVDNPDPETTLKNLIFLKNKQELKEKIIKS